MATAARTAGAVVAATGVGIWAWLAATASTAPTAAPGATHALEAVAESPCALDDVDQWVGALKSGRTIRFAVEQPGQLETVSQIQPLPDLTGNAKATIREHAIQIAQQARTELGDLLETIDPNDPRQLRKWGRCVYDIEVYDACIRALAAGDYVVHEHPIREQLNEHTFFAFPAVDAQMQPVTCNFLFDHRTYPGVAHAAAFVAVRRRAALDEIARSFNSKPDAERRELVERRDMMIRDPDAHGADSLAFLRATFPVGTYLAAGDILRVGGS